MTSPRLQLLPVEAWPINAGIADPGAHRFTALAWQAATNVRSSARLPTVGHVEAVADSESEHGFTEFNHPGAVWIAALQLAMFSLGWESPATGLARWFRTGCPVKDPRLEVIAHLIGPDVSRSTVDLLAFLFMNYGRMFERSRGSHPEIEPDLFAIPDEVRSYVSVWQQPTSWFMPFSGRGTVGDSCHIMAHVYEPIESGGLSTQASLSRVEGGRSAAFVVDDYIGWYSALQSAGATLGARPDGRSWRVDVFVKPVGWMGTYRLSRQTGRWFSGPHSLHEWGIPG